MRCRMASISRRMSRRVHMAGKRTRKSREGGRGRGRRGRGRRGSVSAVRAALWDGVTYGGLGEAEDENRAFRRECRRRRGHCPSLALPAQPPLPLTPQSPLPLNRPCRSPLKRPCRSPLRSAALALHSSRPCPSHLSRPCPSPLSRPCPSPCRFALCRCSSLGHGLRLCRVQRAVAVADGRDAGAAVADRRPDQRDRRVLAARL